MNKISITSISIAIHKGIKTAWNDYYSWSGGLWLNSAPEYVLTTYIASSLGKLKGPKFITLEENPDEALTIAGGRSRGKLAKDIRSDGRMDILLWWGNDTPRAIIEVKNNVFSFSKIENDVKRIVGILRKKESTFQFGAIAIYTDKSDNTRNDAKTLLENRIDTLKSNFKTHANNLQYSYDFVDNQGESLKKDDCGKIVAVQGEDSAWVSCVIIIK